MKLGWTLNRLRNMEPAEVLHRLGEKARQWRSRGRHEGWSRYSAGVLRRVFPDLAARIRSASPEQRRAVRIAAEQALAGTFEALGRRWPQRAPTDLFPSDAWRLDPATGTAWPGDAYCFDIDFRRAGGRGDVKYVWEFNRLQTLPVLAAYWTLEDAGRAGAAIEAAIGSWHAANPPFRGLGWASGIEIALRAISLIVTLDLVGNRLDAGTQRRIGEILAASAFWLPRFPSLFSSANNHRVAALAGQYLIALAIGADPSADRAALAVEIDCQILPDGAAAEHTPTYAAFTA